LGVYLPRIYPDYSASLFAANDLCRSLVATGAIHAGVPLYGKLGIGPGVSILGSMSVLGIPGMWFIYHKGPALRARSRFVVPTIFP
jgi:DHA1 family multidrug resistance protein-like MFS transporter